MTTYAAFGADFIYRALLDRPARTITPTEPMSLNTFSNNHGDESATSFQKPFHEKPTKKVKLMVLALALSTLLLLIRAVYRTIEVCRPITFGT